VRALVGSVSVFALAIGAAHAQPGEDPPPEKAPDEPKAAPDAQPPPDTAKQPAAAPPATPPPDETSKRFDELDTSIDELDVAVRKADAKAQSATPGTTRFLLTGYGFAGFATQPDGDDATFGAGFDPILLWKLTDKLFFEGELELELDDEGTGVGLEYAHGVFVVHDLLTIGAGLFLSPINPFAERLHPAWINKLPDAPLPFGHASLLPTAELGVQARGAVAIGRTARFTYAALISNGPAIDDGMKDPMEAGMLMFENWADTNRDKAVGGRVAIVLPSLLEVGVAAETADVAIAGENLRAILLSADAGIGVDATTLRGSLDARAQVAYTRVPDADFGGVMIDNNVRSGGYVQLGYRPSRIAALKHFEAIVRLDWIRGPDVPEDPDESRGTVGLDWWLTPSTVIKAAFERSTSDEAGAKNVILLQAAMGF